MRQITELKMEELATAPANGEEDDNDDTYRQTTAADRQCIFIACRSTMVNGRLKRGIFSSLAKQLGFERKTIARQWYNMVKSLSTLLSNHSQDDPNVIIQRSHHILFQPEHCKRRAGKFKYDRDNLKVTIASFTCKQRRAVRLLAGQLKLPVGTVHYLLKPRPPPKDSSVYGGIILRRHASKLKPTLKDGNKLCVGFNTKEPW
jgi:hypothetical protein